MTLGGVGSRLTLLPLVLAGPTYADVPAALNHQGVLLEARENAELTKENSELAELRDENRALREENRAVETRLAHLEVALGVAAAQ